MVSNETHKYRIKNQKCNASSTYCLNNSYPRFTDLYYVFFLFVITFIKEIYSRARTRFK